MIGKNVWVIYRCLWSSCCDVGRLVLIICSFIDKVFVVGSITGLMFEVVKN